MTPSPPTAGEVAESALRLRTTEERRDYVSAACEGFPDLLAEVEKLLSRHLDPAKGTTETGNAGTLLLPHQESPGETIGRYRLLKRLGEGGFGTVWEAEQREPVRRRVALKIIKLGMDTREVIARFEAERQALALMDHPNIARVLDGGATDSGRPYFVMELVGGMPLTQYCDTNKLGLRERLELFIPICQAVQHAHQKGIIHRDLKPSNLLVSTVDGKPLPKVIDFGIARATSQQLTDKTLFTQIGQLIGTPEYMSPEQTGLDGQDVDTRTDIYALGVVLYELLTGRTPLDRERLKRAAHAEIQRIVCEEEPPRPSTKLTTLGDKITAIAEHRHIEPAKLKRTLRGDLDWIVMRALEKDRNRRYDTANGFALDVQRYLNDEPVSAGPPSMKYRIGKFVSRNRTGVAAAAAFVFVLLAATSVSLWQAVQATQARKQAERSRASGEKLVSYMLDDLSKTLAPVGRLDLMQGVGEAVLRHYAELEEQGGAPDANLRHGQALVILASVAESTGRAPDADRLGNEAISLIRKWVTANARKPEGMKALAEACEQQARLRNTGRWGRESSSTEAEALMQEAVSLKRELCAFSDSTSEDHISLARTLLEFIRLMPDRDNSELVLEAARVLAKAEQSAELPAVAKVTKAFLILHARWENINWKELPQGWVKDEQGMKGPAAWRLAHEVYDAYPDDVNVKLELALLCKHWQRDLKRDPEGGVAALGAKIANDLTRLDPNNQLWAEHSVKIRLNLAYGLAKMRSIEEAEPSFKQAIEACEDLIEKQPRNLALKEQLCGVYRSIGLYFLETSREKARGYFTEALKVLDELEKAGASSLAENERVWLHIHMSQVMPTVDEQVRVLREVQPIVSRQATNASDGQAQLAAYYVHAEAIRYLESARRYDEALQEADLSVQVIQDSRERTKNPDYMRWLWREVHQSRSRILWRLGRDAEALKDIQIAIEIARTALPGDSTTKGSLTLTEKMSALLQAVDLRLQYQPAPESSEFTEITTLLELVDTQLPRNDSADSGAIKILNYFLGVARHADAVTRSPELEPYRAKIWNLLLKAHGSAAKGMPKDSPGRWNVMKHMTAVILDEAEFIDLKKKQGSLPESLNSVVKLWQERCSDHEKDADAWLYLGQSLLASSKSLKQDATPVRAAVQKATDLWLAAQSDVTAEKSQSLRRLVNTWTELEDWEQAMRVSREYIRCSTLRQGGNDASTFAAMANLISTLKRFNRHADALKLSEELLELRRKIDGQESHAVAVSLRELGALNAQLKAFDKARQLIEESIILCRKLGDIELPDLANGLIELGRLEKTTGNWEQALKLLAEGLDLRKKLFPPDSADVLNLTAELSTALWNSDTHKAEALRLRETLLAFKRSQANPGAPAWIDWLFEYASWQKAEKNFPLAEASAKEAFERYNSNFASGYQPLKAQRLLGGILDAQGKHGEAEQHLMAAFSGMVEIAASLPSSRQGELMSCMNELVAHYKSSPTSSDRLVQWAEESHRRFIAGKSSSPSIPADAIARLASLWIELGRPDKAAELSRMRMDLLKRSPGESGPKTVVAMVELARQLNQNKQFAEAYATYVEAIGVERKLPGHESSSLAGHLQEAGLTAISLKKKDEALQLFLEALDLRRSGGKPERLNLASLEHLIGDFLRDQGDHQNAASHLRQSLDVREKELGSDHKDLAGVLKDLSGVLWKLDQHQEALTLRMRALQILQSVGQKPDSGWTYAQHEYTSWLYQEKQYSEFESAARDGVALLMKNNPNGWEINRARGMLGLALIMLKRFEEAEPPLVQAYEGLSKQEPSLPTNERYQIGVAVDRLVQLYKEWGKPDKQAEWTEIKKALAAKPKP